MRAIGIAGVAVAGISNAQQTSEAVQLPRVQVTGSLIPRAERENADPILTINRNTLERSGATTFGQLLEQLPMVTGDAMTPQVNNALGNAAKGNGASTISLRGLGDVRTLILLDGQRLVSSDVNLLPLNMIDRVEVLKEGAGTVYGSDAIGGVVNFITRKNFTGTEIAATTGEATDHGDATRLGASLTVGGQRKGGRLVFGLSYDRSGSIWASDRAVGATPVAIQFGEVVPVGSSRISTGSYSIDPSINDPATGAPWGCGGLTRIGGTEGRSAADFRCLTEADQYNYQPHNFLYTPSDHLQLFALYSVPFGGRVRGYASLFFNHTIGENHLAPEAFDTSTFNDASGNPLNPAISQYSQYNPLGQDIGSFSLRTTATGDRSTHSSEDLVQGTLGIRATLLDRFEWDSSITYGREDDTYTSYGLLDIAGLTQQIGPSQGGVCYQNATPGADGTVRYSNPIAGCTPINFMGTYGATYTALLYPGAREQQSTELFSAGSSITGALLALPFPGAAPVSATLGFDYQEHRLDDEPDPAAQAFQLSENNSARTQGSYGVGELYGEFLIPIARDRLLLNALNLDLGVRWSDYSNFGSTANGHYAVEYRPLRTLLLRASYADLFRAPAITDLHASSTNSAPLYSDICDGYGGTGTELFPHLPQACRNVPVGYQQPNNQTTITVGGNPYLKPETGYSTDFGLVYSPAWLPSLSVNFDWWAYRIHGAIDPLDFSTAMTGCAVSGDPLFCGNGGAKSPYYRDANGNLVGGLNVPQNLGTLFTDGFDFGLQLNLPHTRFGRFRFDLNGSYLDRFTQSVRGSQGEAVLNYSLAGATSASFTGGGFPRLKFTASLDWQYGNWDMVLRNRFIASESDNGGQDGLGNHYGLDYSGAGYIGYAASFKSGGVYGTGRCNEGGKSYTATDSSGAALFSYACYRDAGYAGYQDLQLTYKVRKLRTDFTLGVNDIFDQGAPMTYTSGPNGSTFNYDASNYEVTGRFVYGRVRLTFGLP